MKWLKYSTDQGGSDLTPVDRVIGARVGKKGGLTLFLSADAPGIQVDLDLIPAAVEALGIMEALGQKPLGAELRDNLLAWRRELDSEIALDLFPSDDLRKNAIANRKKVEKILGLGEDLGKKPYVYVEGADVVADARRYQTLRALFSKSGSVVIYQTPQGVSFSKGAGAEGVVWGCTLGEILDREKV